MIWNLCYFGVMFIAGALLYQFGITPERWVWLPFGIGVAMLSVVIELFYDKMGGKK